jgi:O-acetylhomoserine (thiol)-lyase
MAEQSFETRQVHAGQIVDSQTGARALPIYQTTSFVFPDAKAAADRFALAELGPIYTRLGNPTIEAVEDRIASLEGGVGAVFVASGQAAEFYSIINIVEAGGHVVSSPSLYGGTYNMLGVTLKKFGIDVTFVQNPDDLDEWRAAVKPNTRAFFGEVVSNPRSDVLDLAGVSAVAHEAGVPLIVDNTLATPYLIRPLEHGADVVVHSATKYLGGHGTAIGGVIVDGGTFDYTREPEKFPGFNEPDPSYNGLVFGRDLGPDSDFGANVSYFLKIRVQLLRDLGAAASPFNAFLISQGLETLSLRVERHVSNAQRVAEFLENHPQVQKVNYAGLQSSPWYERGRELSEGRGVGSVLSFDIAGGYDAAVAFVDALQLHSNVANIGDAKSLVIHPASTTHSQLSPEEQAQSAVNPALVRLSVGIEGIEDILADLEVGFAAAK